jgi:propionyl-CoA synthetase
VVDHECRPVKAGEIGALIVKLPLPPGTLATLWNNDKGYMDSYLMEFDGYYKTGDAGFIDEDGYVFVMSRMDDIINVAGHRLSTGGMEEVLSRHPDVAECAVLGVADQLKGQVPVGFVVVKAGIKRDDDEIVTESVKMVRDGIGPVAAFKKVAVVENLPKTRSGKILRGLIQSMAENRELKIPLTIDNPEALDGIKKALERMGYNDHPSDKVVYLRLMTPADGEPDANQKERQALGN